MTPPAPPDGPEMHVPTITVNRVESPHESFTWLGECSCGWESVISLLTFDESVMRDMHFNLMRHALDELRASSAASLGREQALTAERDAARRIGATICYFEGVTNASGMVAEWDHLTDGAKAKWLAVIDRAASSTVAT